SHTRHANREGALPATARLVQDSESGGVREQPAANVLGQDSTIQAGLKKRLLMADRDVLDPRVLEMDCDREIERICARLREILAKEVSRRGYVVAMSGGIDSSVSAALCVKAL